MKYFARLIPASAMAGSAGVPTGNFSAVVASPMTSIETVDK